MIKKQITILSIALIFTLIVTNSYSQLTSTGAKTSSSSSLIKSTIISTPVKNRNQTKNTDNKNDGTENTKKKKGSVYCNEVHELEKCHLQQVRVEGIVTKDTNNNTLPKDGKYKIIKSGDKKILTRTNKPITCRKKVEVKGKLLLKSVVCKNDKACSREKIYISVSNWKCLSK